MLARAILTPAASEIVVLIALGLSLFGVIGLVLAVLLGVRLARLRRGYAVLIGRASIRIAPHWWSWSTAAMPR